MADRSDFSGWGDDSLSPQSLPHSDDAEQAILGSVLIDPEMISVALDIIRPEYFHLEQHKVDVAVAEAKEQAAKLEGKKVVIRAKAGQGGRLFGAVTPGNVADVLKEQFGFDLDKRKITVSGEMKNEGDYSAEAKFYSGISAKFTVSVVAENG